MSATRIFTLSAMFVAVISSQAMAQGRVDTRGTFNSTVEIGKAIANFEKLVNRTRGIRSSDKSLVTKLRRATDRMLIYAKNPRLTSRLKSEYRKVDPLITQVDDRIFGRYTPNRDLLTGWEAVLYADFRFNTEFSIRVANPRGANTVQRLGASQLGTTQRLGTTTASIVPTLNQRVPAPAIAPVR